MKHAIKRVRQSNGEWSPDTYEYRGYMIRRDDSTPSGYYGRWRVCPNLYITDSRQHCIAWIDKRLVAILCYP